MPDPVAAAGAGVPPDVLGTWFNDPFDVAGLATLNKA